MMRDFIRASLYHPTKGYFASSASPVGTLDAPLDFGFLVGESGYRAKLREQYERLGCSWLTPAEIFRPHFGKGIARYVLAEHGKLRTREPLRIVEVGAGAGGLAVDILDHIKLAAPHLYRDVSYTSIEASGELAGRQTERVSKTAGHGDRFRVSVRDATERGALGKSDTRHAFLIAMEVLDNMPHDLLVREARGGVRPWSEVLVGPRDETEAVDAGGGGSAWEQLPGWVLNERGDQVVEATREISDALVRRTLGSYDWEQQFRSNSSSRGLMGLVDWAFGTG